MPAPAAPLAGIHVLPPAFTSLQPPCRLGDQAEIGMGADIEAGVDVAELFRHIDVALQSVEIGHHVGIAIVVVFGEQPAEAVGRLLGQPRGDRGNRVVVRGIEIPVNDPQRILQEVDECGAMRVDERLAHRPL